MKTLDDLAPDLRERLAKVRMLIMDIDGVLTDGLIRLDENGVESKTFSTRDGFALVWVRKYGLATGAISGRLSRATELRCKDLHFDEVYLGTVDKLPALEEILQRRNLSAGEVAYIGDDFLDLAVMRRVGVSAAPNNSHAEVLSRVDLILDQPGGYGAVRHFLDLWLMAIGKYDSIVEEMCRGTI